MEEHKQPSGEAITMMQAADLIADRMDPEPEPEVEAEPEKPLEEQIPPQVEPPSQTQITQAQLAAAQQELLNEQAAIHELERDARSLRESNPGEYSARLAELSLRQNRLDTAAQKFTNYVSQAEANMTKRALAEHQRNIAREQQALEQAIPGWGQEKKAEIVAYLERQGYTKEQLASITDHRPIVAAWKAYQTDMAPKKQRTLKRKPQPVTVKDRFAKRAYRHGTLVNAADRIRKLGL